MLSSWLRCSQCSVLDVDCYRWLGGFIVRRWELCGKDILVVGRPLAFGLLAVSSAGWVAGGSESIERCTV
jgi:hypothetical protein